MTPEIELGQSMYPFRGIPVVSLDLILPDNTGLLPLKLEFTKIPYYTNGTLLRYSALRVISPSSAIGNESFNIPNLNDEKLDLFRRLKLSLKQPYSGALLSAYPLEDPLVHYSQIDYRFFSQPKDLCIPVLHPLELGNICNVPFVLVDPCQGIPKDKLTEYYLAGKPDSPGHDDLAISFTLENKEKVSMVKLPNEISLEALSNLKMGILKRMLDLKHPIPEGTENPGVIRKNIVRNLLKELEELGLGKDAYDLLRNYIA